MDILAALRQEEGKLQHRLNGIQIAIAALNGHSRATIVTPNGATRKRMMSAAARAQDFEGDEGKMGEVQS